MSNRFSSYNPEIPARLISCLNDSRARYQILHEPSGFSDYEQLPAASIGHIETAVVRAGKQRVLAVIPSRHSVDLKKFARFIGEPVRLETADDFKWVFPDCALGAIPPFGNLYGLPTYVDRSVARNKEIVFSAGTSTDSIQLAYVAYTEIVKPLFGRFAVGFIRDHAASPGRD
jgi:Ala-tRNA(Pro) deacylase